ncbi:DUF5359 family protein [Thalassobacillus hwangdonensis]|uniref:DUF5359 family protein n=1 Tax=Thalassobacillus hwangdonensis TaxID=546108 RepID=A0ABW3KY77_9BACI
MKRIERIILSLILIHGLLLLLCQFLLLETEWVWQLHPIQEYLGVFNQQPATDRMDF